MCGSDRLAFVQAVLGTSCRPRAKRPSARSPDMIFSGDGFFMVSISGDAKIRDYIVHFTDPGEEEEETLLPLEIHRSANTKTLLLSVEGQDFDLPCVPISRCRHNSKGSYLRLDLPSNTSLCLLCPPAAGGGRGDDNDKGNVAAVAAAGGGDIEEMTRVLLVELPPPSASAASAAADGSVGGKGSEGGGREKEGGGAGRERPAKRHRGGDVKDGIEVEMIDDDAGGASKSGGGGVVGIGQRAGGGEWGGAEAEQERTESLLMSIRGLAALVSDRHRHARREGQEEGQGGEGGECYKALLTLIAQKVSAQVREAHNLKNHVEASRGRSLAAGGDADFEARVSELYKSKKGLSPCDVSAADGLASDYLRNRVAGLDALMQGAWGG